MHINNDKKKCILYCKNGNIHKIYKLKIYVCNIVLDFNQVLKYLNFNLIVIITVTILVI